MSSAQAVHPKEKPGDDQDSQNIQQQGVVISFYSVNKSFEEKTEKVTVNPKTTKRDPESMFGGFY